MEKFFEITALKPQKKRKDRYNVYVDDEYTVSLSAETCMIYQLKTGSRVDEDTWKEAVFSDNTKYAFDRAVSLLSHKMRTRSELIDRLLDKDIDENAVHAAIEKLSDYGYVDDITYAKEFVQSAILAGKHGRKVVSYKLKTKGIDDDIIEDALNGYTHDIEKEIAQGHLEILSKQYQNEQVQKKRRKIYAALTRRGFDYDIINTLLAEEEKF